MKTKQKGSTLLAELVTIVCFGIVFVATLYIVATDKDHCTICGAYAPCYNHAATTK